MSANVAKTNPSVGRRKLMAAAAGAGAISLLPRFARAQSKFPVRPITLYGALPAGGIQDTHLRFLGERASKILGQPIAIEPKPGAGATLAPTLLLNASPDGHTLASNTVNSFRYPHYEKTNYHPLKDFEFVIGLSNFTFAVTVRADSPFKSIEDLIAAAKVNPGKFTSGSTGHGGTGHLILIELQKATGTTFSQVPFKGGPEAIAALLGGHIDFMIDGVTPALIGGGRARFLALATEKPSERFPGVPTLREKGIDAVGWSPYGILAPKSTPREIIMTLHDAFKQAMSDPGHQELLDKFIMPVWYKSPEEFRAWAEKYYTDVLPLLRTAGLVKS